MSLEFKNNSVFYLERIAALHRSMMRQFAQKNELQMVHLEILLYLEQCNKYSDTTQALTNYLGQTKGSISQSLGFLEEANYIKRQQDQTDKRIFHLLTTGKGKALLSKFNEYFKFPKLSNEASDSLLRALVDLQKRNDFKSFGICASCRFNTQAENGKVFCGLTHETLTTSETKKRCLEHVES